MKVTFITTNKHKFEEVVDILKPYDIELEQLDMEYDENHDASMEEVVRGAVRLLADELDKPVLIEDTGLFFKAYDGFPGALPKFVINTLGFKGIFKLLEGENRDAEFVTVAGYCEPGGEPQLFEGYMKGQIHETIENPDKDEMPYDKIFFSTEAQKLITHMTIQEKTKISQRAEALRKFGDYMTSKTKN